MILDIIRSIVISIKFILFDIPKKTIDLLFRRQNPKIKQLYNKRIKNRRL